MPKRHGKGKEMDPTLTLHCPPAGVSLSPYLGDLQTVYDMHLLSPSSPHLHSCEAIQVTKISFTNTSLTYKFANVLQFCTQMFSALV